MSQFEAEVLKQLTIIANAVKRQTEMQEYEFKKKNKINPNGKWYIAADDISVD